MNERFNILSTNSARRRNSLISTAVVLAEREFRPTTRERNHVLPPTIMALHRSFCAWEGHLSSTEDLRLGSVVQRGILTRWPLTRVDGRWR